MLKNAPMRPPRRALRAALWGVLALAQGCDSCADEPPNKATPTAAAGARAEDWTLGAAGLQQSFALPPPCRLLEGSLRAAVERPTQVVTAAGALDQVIGVQGPLLGLTAATTSHDAASIYRMQHGPAPHHDVGWPQQGNALRAYQPDKDTWMVSYAEAAGSAVWKGRVRRRADAGRREGKPTLGAGVQKINARVLDLRCGNRGCGMLLASQQRGVATLRLGDIDDAIHNWLTLTMRHDDVQRARPISLLAVDNSGVGSARVAFVDDVRLRVVGYQQSEDAPLPQTTVVASMQVPHGVLAVVDTPQPAALAYTGPLDARGCSAAAGGVLLVPATGQAATLRSPLPPSEATLTPLSQGWLVSWRSPLRCTSHQQLLYAAVVGPQGRPLAPVTTVGEADSYAVSARQDEVAVWVVQGHTVSWMRWHCGWRHP